MVLILKRNETVSSTLQMKSLGGQNSRNTITRPNHLSVNTIQSRVCVAILLLTRVSVVAMSRCSSRTKPSRSLHVTLKERPSAIHI